MPGPRPSPNEYLIAIHAAATNFFDLLQIRGKYQHQPTLPWIAGSEFAGVVAETPSVNSSSNKYKIGDCVFGAAQGGFATLVCVTEEALLPVPDGWGFADSAGLMVTAPTSYAALVTRTGVQRGDWVLVHAAAGGVGLAAVQIAKAFGATVIATAESARKREVARSFGADHAIDYKQAGWEEQVRTLTPNKKGVDIVFDPVGLVNASLKCVGWNGRIVVIGFASGTIDSVAMNRVLLKNVSLVGLHWGLYARQEPQTVDKVWEGLFDLIRQGRFRPTRFVPEGGEEDLVGLECVGKALGMLGRRETWGKVVVEVRQEPQKRMFEASSKF